MTLKGVTQREVADEFGIRQPSVSEWLRFGRVDKAHITHLVEYFSDVVGPEHWGLPSNWTAGALAPRTDLDRLIDIARHLRPQQLHALMDVAAAMLPDHALDAGLAPADATPDHAETAEVHARTAAQAEAP